jgi:2-oxoglutarate ferredoxin oxidoreductase subunit beta
MRNDFISNQEVRWCPGCGDYAILAAMQRTMPELNIPRENTVFVSGIGCSGRFPYYMNTYGFHTIHGRAPAVASGLKLANPHLSVWVITGDGDGLSIGANHLMHMLRRNFDIKVLLFNNRIYGLTKGQYSPTSEQGKITSTTPEGSLDRPINPIAFALSAGATFVARVLDVDQKNLNSLIKKAAAHKGSVFIEIYQNCNIFNDGAFQSLSDKSLRDQNTIFHEHPAAVLSDAFHLSQVDHPVHMGLLWQEFKPTYEELLKAQNHSKQSSLEGLLSSGHVWDVL